MHILYLIPSLSNPGGMERVLTEKINYLVNVYGFDITIMTTDQMGAPVYFDLHKKVKIIHLDLDFNSHFGKNLLRKLIATKGLLKKYRSILEIFLKSQKVNVCISLGGKELEFLYKIKTDTKIICELHFGQSIREQFLTARSNNILLRNVGVYRTKQLIKQTQKLDKLVVLTKADKEVWERTNNNVEHIYNFVTSQSDKVSSLEPKRVIAIGRLDAQKGFDLLIEAWELVSKENETWKLDIYGKGEWQDLLNDKIKNKKLEEQVFLKGVTKNVEQELLASSIFVLSSRYEGFAMVLLESISYGLPIVAFDCKTGPSEIINDNDCGILVPAENIEKLAEGINVLIRNEEIRKQKGLVAKQKSEFFSKEKIMQQWYELIKSLV